MAALIPAGPIPFALNPAQAVPGAINFTTREGQKYYDRAVEPLNKETDRFDATPEKLRQFRALLSNRAREFQWTADGGILLIPKDPTAPLGVENVNLIDHYGERSLETLKQWEETYIRTPTRMAQDTHMLYNCIMNSLSPEGKDKVELWRDDFHIGNLPSGVLLLKVLVRESHIDSNATATSIRTQMAKLDEHMVEIGSDIPSFNLHVKELISSLAARGETSTDLLVNLFNAYKAAGDEEFVKYITDKESRYDEGSIEMTIPTLMELASNKYKILVLKKKWKAKTKDQESIIALQSQLSDLKKKLRDTSKVAGRKNDKQDAKTKNKKTDTSTKKQKPQWLAKNEPPNDADLKKGRSWNGKTYYYCSPKTGGKCPGHWNIHRPSDCEGKRGAKRMSPGDDKDKDQRKLKLAKAMVARMDKHDDPMSESDESE